MAATEQAKHTPVKEWIGDFKLMAGLLATIEESASHDNDTKDWSNRLCDCAFFAQRVAHVMLDLQPKYLELLEALKGAEKALFHAWLSAPEGAPTRTAERKLKAARAAIAKAEGRSNG